jgi:hypothetical protein
MPYSWYALFFASILVLSTILVFSQALAYDNPITRSNLPLNSSAYLHPPNSPYYYSKENGTDLEITATVYNPINLFGNVTDPDGMVHQMNTISSEKGMTQLRFYASVSDPNGIYVARFQLINGPATSDLVVNGGPVNYQKPGTLQSLHIPMSPRKQITNGVSPENVVCINNLVLIKKISDGSPACVKPQTAQKLVERGWGIMLTSSTSVSHPTQTGTLSGYANIGGGPACNPSVGCLNLGVNYEVDVYASDGITIVGKTHTDANTNYSIQIPAGNYILYTYGFHKQAHPVSIIAGQNTIFNIVYDSGMR